MAITFRINADTVAALKKFSEGAAPCPPVTSSMADVVEEVSKDTGPIEEVPAKQQAQDPKGPKTARKAPAPPAWPVFSERCRAALLALLGALPTRGQEVCETTGALTRYGGSLQQMNPWRHTMFLIILVVVVFVLGFCAGRLSLRTNMRTVRTQSQVTYRRDLATPRFAPLGDKDHGGWAE